MDAGKLLIIIAGDWSGYSNATVFLLFDLVKTDSWLMPPDHARENHHLKHQTLKRDLSL